ncbi:MAG: hypothetical protein ACW981_20145 [Candidatus Hodarchaeales archaeon]
MKTNFIRRYEKALEFPLHKNLDFKPYSKVVIIQMAFYTLIFVSLVLFLIGVINHQIQIMNFIIILLWGLFFLILEVLRHRVQTFKNNIDFFGIFLAHEFKLLLETTQSMAIAVNYLIKTIPYPLKHASKKFLNEQNITGKFPEQAIIQLFKSLELPLLEVTFRNIVNDWHNGTYQITNNKFSLENSIQIQIELYNKSFSSWSSLISALSALFPLFAFFLFLMIGYQSYEYFFVITIYLIIISFCFYLIDPFSIKFLKQSGISDKSFSSGWSAAHFTENLAKNLQIHANGELALKLTIMSLIKEKKINFTQFNDLNSNFKSSLTNEMKPDNKNLLNSSLSLTSFLVDLVDSKKFLQMLLPTSEFPRIKFIIDFTQSNTSIDINTTITHLYSLSTIQFNIENILQQRIILIKSEYRKNLLLLVLQSCVIGLLIGLGPFFSIIRSISLIQDSSEFYVAILTINSIQSMGILLFFCSIYLIAQILTIKAVYNKPNREVSILLFLLLFTCIFSGYNFVRLILSTNVL